MLLEDGPLAHFRICSIAVSSSIVDCIVLELIGFLIMLVFGFVLEPRLALIFGGRLAFIQKEAVTYQPSRYRKERPPSGSFQLTLRHFSSAD